ncbi:MAG: hypothetical protein ACYC4H_05480 [Desulfocucumaceae bacterium]
MGIRVEVETTGWMRQRLGNQCVYAELNGEEPTLADLVALMATQNGSWFRDLVLDINTGYLSGSVVTVVDRQVIHRQDPAMVKLEDAVTVCFLVAVDGG